MHCRCPLDAEIYRPSISNGGTLHSPPSYRRDWARCWTGQSSDVACQCNVDKPVRAVSEVSSCLRFRFPHLPDPRRRSRALSKYIERTDVETLELNMVKATRKAIE